jgi:glutamine amidotransferase
MTSRHSDGWGIAGYLGKWATHFGRSEKGADVDAAAFLEASRKAVDSRSRIIVAHLRKASDGKPAVTSSHPFIHYDWIFAHNGTIENSEKLIIPRYRYEGTTDSERFFKFLVERLYRHAAKDYPAIIRRTIAEIKELCHCTSLTFLLSGGKHLIAYRDYSEEESYYTLSYAQSGDTAVFCSEEIPGFEWTPLKNGDMMVADKYGGVNFEP